MGKSWSKRTRKMPGEESFSFSRDKGKYRGNELETFCIVMALIRQDRKM